MSVRARHAVLRPALPADHRRLREIAAASKGYTATVGQTTSSWGRTIPVMQVEL
ncbi:MAG: hypothetical protein ACXWYS_01220 [Gaiellaceae bacterium]